MLVADVQLHRPGFELNVRLRCAGGLLGVMGPSGSGKTTLLYALAGLIRPDSGRIVLNGRPLFEQVRGQHQDSRAWTPPHRRRIAMAFQDDRLWSSRSVHGNLLYTFRRVTGRPRHIVPEQVIDALELGPLLNRRVTNLSGGECRRVGLARALLANPELLLLDEPTSGLDGRMRDRVLQLMGHVVTQQHTPTIMVSHHMEDLLRLSQQLLVMPAGHTVESQQTSASIAPATCAAGEWNRLALTVKSHQPAAGITRLVGREMPADRTLEIRSVLQPELAPGSPVVALLPADQIVLAMAPVETVSMQNQLQGQVVDLIPQGDSIICRIHVGWMLSARGGSAANHSELPLENRLSAPVGRSNFRENQRFLPLVARITRQAAADFNIRPGVTVWCLCKASAWKVFADATADGNRVAVPPNAGHDFSGRIEGFQSFPRGNPGTRKGARTLWIPAGMTVSRGGNDAGNPCLLE